MKQCKSYKVFILLKVSNIVKAKESDESAFYFYRWKFMKLILASWLLNHLTIWHPCLNIWAVQILHTVVLVTLADGVRGVLGHLHLHGAGRHRPVSSVVRTLLHPLRILVGMRTIPGISQLRTAHVCVGFLTLPKCRFTMLTFIVYGGFVSWSCCALF